MASARDPDTPREPDEDEPDGEEPTRADTVSDGPYPRLLDYQLLTPRAPLAPGAAMRVYPPPMMPDPKVPAQWAADPRGRHQWRWWNGVAWTEHVADDGVASIDPLD